MNTSRKHNVEHILWKILGDGPEAQRAFERVNRRLRRQAKVDRLLAPWFRVRRWFRRRIFGRKERG